MKVQNLINSKGNKIVNQFIITDGNNETFQSYDSTICTVDRDNRIAILFPDYDYSVTTSKYLYQFLNERFGLKLNKRLLQQCIKDGSIGAFKLVLRE